MVFFHTNDEAKARSLVAALAARGYAFQARPMNPALRWEPKFLEHASWLVKGHAPPLTMAEEPALRAVLEAGGRTVRSLMLRPQDKCQSIQATFESPYWHLPGLPAGHARRFVM